MRVRKNSRLIDNVFMYNKPYLTSCLVIKSSLELLPLLFLPIYPFLSLFRSEATSTYYFVRLPGRPYVCLIWQLPRWALIDNRNTYYIMYIIHIVDLIRMENRKQFMELDKVYFMCDKRSKRPKWNEKWDHFNRHPRIYIKLTVACQDLVRVSQHCPRCYLDP